MDAAMRNIIALGWIALAVCLAPAGASAQPLPIKVQCRIIGSIYVDQLIKACTEVIETRNESGRALATAYIARGRAYHTKGEFDRAIADFNQALKEFPDNALALRSRGSAYFAKGEFDHTIKDLSNAIVLTPRDLTLYRDRALAYEGKGDYARAVDDYSEMIRISPKSVQALGNRCYLRAKVNRDLTQALEDCDEALKAARNDPVTLERRGLVYLRMGNFDRARGDFEAVLKVNPSNVIALYGRGIARRGIGDARGGESDITEARALRPELVEQLIGFGFK
jgi:tetratricopeptide (TPR) repeat protein